MMKRQMVKWLVNELYPPEGWTYRELLRHRLKLMGFILAISLPVTIIVNVLLRWRA